MKKNTRWILIGLATALGLCALLLGAHVIVNKVDFAGMLKSMHGAR